ncbi:hypothetical protein MMC28_004056 [Mycoblastus sanguinarius]|nr:hypothetical protein [Mycoblastus sanguinarius]
MLPSSITTLPLFIITALASAVPNDKLALSLRNSPPPLSPSTTVGDFITSFQKRDLEARQQDDTIPHLKRDFGTGGAKGAAWSSWSDGANDFNISLSNCVTFGTVAGEWLFVDGSVKEMATVQDIASDIQSLNGDEKKFASHLLDNANRFLTGISAFVDDNLVCSPSGGADRELKAQIPAGTYQALGLKTAVGGLVGYGITAAIGEAFNTTLTGQALTLGAASGASITFAVGLVDLLHQAGAISGIQAFIVGTWVAWGNKFTSTAAGDIEMSQCINANDAVNAVADVANVHDDSLSLTSYGSATSDLDQLC